MPWKESPWVVWGMWTHIIGDVCAQYGGRGRIQGGMKGLMYSRTVIDADEQPHRAPVNDADGESNSGTTNTCPVMESIVDS
eukprot:gene12007-biopygen9690